MPNKSEAKPENTPAGSSASGTDILNAAAAGEIRTEAPAVPKRERPETTPAATPPVGAIPNTAAETRSIALPASYWQAIEGLAERGGVSVDVWLERYLRQFGR